MPVNGTLSLWDTVGIVDRLLRLHAAGNRIRDIAIALSDEFHVKLTRNSVISKLRRLNPPPPKKKKKKKKLKTAKPPPKAAPTLPPFRPRHNQVHFAYYPPAPPKIIHSLDISIYQLNDSTCRFPLGGGPPYKFCGLPVIGDCPYCPDHCEMSRVVPRKRWN